MRYSTLVDKALIALLVLLCAMPACGLADVTNGLIAHWKLDETNGTAVADSAGSHDGTIKGTPTPTWTTGKVDGALEFESGTARIDTGTFTLPPSFTLSMWIKPNKLSGSQRILHKRDTEDIVDSFMFTVTPDAYEATVYAQPVVKTERTPTNKWEHISIAVQMVGNSFFVKLYRNGSILWADASLYTWSDSNTALTIGNSRDLNMSFQGVVDDVRLYNRVLAGSEYRKVMVASPPPESLDPSGPPGTTPSPTLEEIYRLLMETRLQAINNTILLEQLSP